MIEAETSLVSHTTYPIADDYRHFMVFNANNHMRYTIITYFTFFLLFFFGEAFYTTKTIELCGFHKIHFPWATDKLPNNGRMMLGVS